MARSRRGHSPRPALEQIASDLNRVERQVELAVEEGDMPGEPAVIFADVDLASDLLDDGFGAAGPDVAALDRRYGTPAPRPSEGLSRS